MEINNQWISGMTDREKVHMANPAEPKIMDVDCKLDASDWK